MNALQELPRTIDVRRSAGVFVSHTATHEVWYPGDEADDLIEEPIDYEPIGEGRVAAPEHPPEEWPDGSGPGGF